MNTMDSYEIFDNQETRKFENFELLANQIVEGFIIGLHKSPFHGFSVEFAEHRLYNPGESTKNIDWKVYGRTDKLFVKRFEEETNLRCQIIIDASSSMSYPIEKAESFDNKVGFSTKASAALMNLLKKQRDAFGLSIFDQEVRVHTKCKGSTTHYRLMLQHLQSILPVNKGVDNNTAECLHQIAESIHRRSLVVLFSDMFEHNTDTEALFAALQHLKYNKHEVIFFHVTDKTTELNFDFENRPYEFIDIETDERIKVQPNQVKEHYLQKIQSFTEELKMKCLQYKIDFVEADIGQGFAPILEAYLVKRNKMGV